MVFFCKDSRRWASADQDNNNYGIINLDNKNGPGTQTACFVNSFYFDPFGLPPREVILYFIKRYNTLQYQKKISVLYGYFCLFFMKKFQDGNSIYDALYKI